MLKRGRCINAAMLRAAIAKLQKGVLFAWWDRHDFEQYFRIGMFVRGRAGACSVSPYDSWRLSQTAGVALNSLNRAYVV